MIRRCRSSERGRPEYPFSQIPARSLLPIAAKRKPPIAGSVVNVRRWALALFTEPTPVEAFAALDVPTLYMVGNDSPESAHAVARVLLPALRRVEVIRFPSLGHMAPLTHPEVVNAEIARFLREV